jgi:exopolysaccharide biosynthesis polyprenyl glycosylphosphotransferase
VFVAFLTNGQTKTRRGFEWTRARRQASEESARSGESVTGPQPSRSEQRAWWRPRGGRLRFVLLGSDVAAAAAAWLVVLAIHGDLFAQPLRSLGLVAAVALVAVLFATHWGLYLARVNTVRSAELAAIFRIAVITSVLGWLVAKGLGVPIWWVFVALAGVFMFLFLAASRNGFDVWIKSRRRAGAYCRHILLVGRDEAAMELLELVHDQPELGYRVLGFVGPRFETSEEFPVTWVSDYPDLAEAVKETEANGVIVAASALGNRSLRAALCDLVELGVHVQVSTGLQGLDHRRLRASTVGYEPVLYLEPLSNTSWERHVKRAMDLVIASIALLIALPVLAVAAAAIKLHDRGPVFFRQERIGRGGRPFLLLKLRTMETDAESKLAALVGDNQRDGPLFKLGVDPRVTPPGRLLRASSLDELPQLINVLKGQMSLVGPRPPLASEFDQFDEELQQRQQLTPGITGLWQLEARDNPSFRTYRRLDLFYLRNWSISLDLMILLLTAYNVVIRTVAPSRMTEESPASADVRSEAAPEERPAVTVA